MADDTPVVISRETLPPVSENRFWVIKHNPKSVSTPVTIELREYNSPAAQERKMEGFSRLIGLMYTTAETARLLEDAFKLEARVGNIDNVVGVY